MMYLRLLRTRHWIKNLFVVAPLVFSHDLYLPEKQLATFYTFVSFCAISSCVYIINDIVDRDKDRHHPLKRNRPIAQGAVSVPTALIISVALFIVAAFFSSAAGQSVLAVTGIFLALNILYSFVLKQMVIVDVMTIALGFVLRVIAGLVAIQAPFSPWLVVITFFISLFLGFSKRRHELVSHADSIHLHRPTLLGYNTQLLDYMMILSAGLTLTTYSLYTIDPVVAARLQTDNLPLTIPFVLYGLFRYLHIIYVNAAGGDAVEVMTRDTPMIINCLLWVVTVVFIVYAR